VFKKLNKLKFLWNQRRIENKEASFASAPFSNNMALDLCNVEWACSWSLVMPAMFCKLRILPTNETKLFQLIMNEKYKTDKPSRGKWQKWLSCASNQLGEFELVQQSKKFVLGL